MQEVGLETQEIIDLIFPEIILDGITKINLNSQYIYLQLLGSRLALVSN